MKKGTLHILTLCLLMMLMAACAPSLPDGVLTRDEMEDVLYDFHIAQTLYDTREYHSTESDIIALRANVLKKHGLTQQEWDKSMAYYCQHADELHHARRHAQSRRGDHFPGRIVPHVALPRLAKAPAHRRARSSSLRRRRPGSHHSTSGGAAKGGKSGFFNVRVR